MAGVLRASALLRASIAPFTAQGEEGAMAIFARLAEAVSLPPTRIMADYAALSLGPGRVSLSDYERLRLYDEPFWGDADRRHVVGPRRFRELCLRANFRHDWLGLTANRLAWRSYLAAHALPTAPLLAIYRADLATPAANLLRSRGELREFLTAHGATPVIAHPAEGGRSRGLFETPNGDAGAEIEALLEDVADTPGVAWLLEPRLAPHPALEAATAGRMAPVRVVTIAGEDGPRVFRALWRLPGAKGALAELDLRTGRALRVAPADNPALSRRAPSALAVPDWPAMKAVAGEAARLLDAFGLVGWDIAPAAEGPVIVGVSAAPDLDACQMLQRSGLLDAEFQAFLADRRRLALDHARFLPDPLDG
ncbi:MAG TPA: sugar-transfer associated ATP-grasp domain-containing protein [Caulobacteraceae bacterium]|nr:sugar-transfer associated ATP-grasp domain-containing protein [Caulobacteraceae bacterium]